MSDSGYGKRNVHRTIIELFVVYDAVSVSLSISAELILTSDHLYLMSVPSCYC